MSNRAKLAVGGVGIGIVLMILGVPFWLALLVIIGVPVAAYLTLDPSQRRRLKRISRRQIGR
ncbi:hypothetical protein [Streptomyces sp. H39-S7]|uniref:hypothetical protein n=1 Tax=Streptomyces sp. H39-S7 TaxID=3004357 RepID=UPI0022AFC4A3|nr:hypothetical protein [Streptomyces sp. H39-S7]MCZ4120441.1 hypothetical protein [Streptomyces sp. H39-S7]